MVLIVQKQGQAFADVLKTEFSTTSTALIATAWVRASGVAHLHASIAGLLERRGRLRVVVGLDAENTSFEGLAMLLGLGDRCKVWVRHNEAWPLFHPKLYGFSDNATCRVYVGSNNLTAAGLIENEEVSALLTGEFNGELWQSVDAYFSSLTAKNDPLALRLDDALLNRLLDRGYVQKEARLRSRLRSSIKQPKLKGKLKPLFGSLPPTRRPLPKNAPVPGPLEPDPKLPTANWTRVLLRLRVARETQGQLPVTVVREIRRRLGMPTGDGPLEVILRGTTAKHVISPTYPERGNKKAANTYKIEVFKPRGSVVVRLDLVGSDVIFEQLDTVDLAGQSIERFILEGLEETPPATVSTRADTSKGTLYRFD